MLKNLNIARKFQLFIILSYKEVMNTGIIWLNVCVLMVLINHAIKVWC